MATSQAASSLASGLPKRLRNFFARYPPQVYSTTVRPPVTVPKPFALAQAAAATTAPNTTTTTTSTTTTTTTTTSSSTSSSTPVTDAIAAASQLPSPYTPNREAKGYQPPDHKYSDALLWRGPKGRLNPFLPRKLGERKWEGPRISLRRQAELVKLARKFGVEELLPPSRKSAEYKEARRAENQGLAVKGTGVGQKVKGHKWERTMEARLEDRRKAMLEMPEMVRLWKQRGHGRGWKQWPKK
ncbi:hypothetical protein BO86DRAFT_385823 [Aspergillus japonicus CBS 114.51]|uniref:Large ribosomal subunit protein mL59 domain-containing protein n=2 Tax=Aspergillus TaxID=5052 RepID=A0A2V5HIE8_ASPV1|nr:hypothetical protein BO86DRAFT_385823 [Aspergillus japonicus CBS 114.51]PYI22322.1 hypothetical protein BO99DRAFT_400129 [Aspergillus violaceofuscus CBS 115571]RAH85510.1 hypothetical protein BO86DRAFT_385823 [Aspergillus japonicus CBS 114.51]